MTVETMAAFARRLGVQKSYVHRMKTEGRLVLTEDGRVDVEKSLQRLHDTGGARPDVAERNAEKRGRPIHGQPNAVGEGGEPGRSTGLEGIGNSYQDARAVKEKYLALQVKLEYERQVGNLIPREDVDHVLKAVGASIRAKHDVLADQLAPIVAPVTDMNEVHALLAEKFREVLAAVADDLRRAEEVLVEHR
jgi:hypothetical protein